MEVKKLGKCQGNAEEKLNLDDSEDDYRVTMRPKVRPKSVGFSNLIFVELHVKRIQGRSAHGLYSCTQKKRH